MESGRRKEIGTVGKGEKEREVLGVDEREAGTVAAKRQSHGTHNSIREWEGTRRGVLYAENAVCLIIRHLAMARSIALRLMDLHR